MGSVVTYYSKNDPDFILLEERMVGKTFYLPLSDYENREGDTIDDGVMIRCTDVIDDEHGLRIGWEWDDDEDTGGNQEHAVEEALEYVTTFIDIAKPYTD